MQRLKERYEQQARQLGLVQGELRKAVRGFEALAVSTQLFFRKVSPHLVNVEGLSVCGEDGGGDGCCVCVFQFEFGVRDQFDFQVIQHLRQHRVMFWVPSLDLSVEDVSLGGRIHNLDCRRENGVKKKGKGINERFEGEVLEENGACDCLHFRPKKARV